MIVIGSLNKAKVLAVKESIMESPNFVNKEVIAVTVESNVSEQPLSLEETIQGSKNRAKNAFDRIEQCQYSFGIESGLMKVDATATGYLHISACCIFDGKNFYTGMSTGFEIPPTILDLVLNKKMDLSQACLYSKISHNAHIGSTEGLIGILTKGRVDRKEYSKQCIMAAIVQLENSEWYPRLSDRALL